MLEDGKQCKVISSGNISLFNDEFDAIPDNLLINFIMSILILAIFFWMKEIAWSRQNDILHIYKDGWITLMFRDACDLLEYCEFKCMRCSYTPLDRNMSYCQMMWHSFFKLTNQEIEERCGADAVQYLRFLKCTIVYNAINSLLGLLCILPANFQGNMQEDRSLFVRTTMRNLDFGESDIIWVHLCVSFSLMIFCLICIRTLSSGLTTYQNSPWSERSVLIRKAGTRPVTSERIERYFRDILPSAEIIDIKLAYKYKDLIALNKKLKDAEEALEICQHISSTEGRDVYVKETCWWCHFWSRIPCHAFKIDGITYYRNKSDDMKKRVAAEINRLPSKSLRIAYVTFKYRYLTYMAMKSNKVLHLQIADDRYLEIHEAHDPGNIIWENLSKRGSYFTCKTLCVNTAVFCVAVFLTTPTIILYNFNIKTLTRHTFFPTVVLWFLSLAIPALVTYSSGFLDFETKSRLNRSIMLKTVIFLIFTVVLLPSLDIPSISELIKWSITNSDVYETWECIFLPDNGSFFVSYVMTAAFIGNIIQLLQLPEIFFFTVRILMAKSEAEKIRIRRSCIWDFSYGVQYAHGLLIFTLVLFYSFLCPVITPFGLAYFIIKYGVDRYNIFYSCSPSHLSHRVHAMAIKFMIFALIMKFVGLFSYVYFRGGSWSILYSFLVILVLNLSICFVSMNPCHLKFIPKYLLMPHKIHFRLYHDHPEQDIIESEIFQPFAIRKYINYISTLDKYDNILTRSTDDQIESEDDDKTVPQLMHGSMIDASSSSE